MKFISVNLLDTPKFVRLFDENEYLNSVVEEINGRFTILVDDTREIERLLNSNNIKFKIKRI